MWNSTISDAVELRLSPCSQYVAWRTAYSNAAEIVHLLSGKEVNRMEGICSPWHPAQVRKIQWISGGNKEDGDSAILSTETVDGTIRIWKCFPDEPHYFVLWLAIKNNIDNALPIANIWFHANDSTKLVSVLENGSLLLHDIKVCIDIMLLLPDFYARNLRFH